MRGRRYCGASRSDRRGCEGKAIRVEESGTKLEGTTEGLDKRGFLQVRTSNGLQTVLSGTVRAR